MNREGIGVARKWVKGRKANQDKEPITRLAEVDGEETEREREKYQYLLLNHKKKILVER